MESEEKVRTLNYSGIFLTCVSDDGVVCTPMVRNHMLAYVYSGEMVVDHDGRYNPQIQMLSFSKTKRLFP